MKELLGRRILAIWRNGAKTVLAFDTDEGTFAYAATGDCCSESWFQHFSLVECLLGQIVRRYEHTNEDGERVEDAAEDIALDRRNDDACVKAYSFDFVTDSGDARIEMRNASNGYYSGSVERVGTGKPFDCTIPVTEDW